MLKTISKHVSIKRVAMMAILSQACLLQLGGCFDREVIFGALANSLALTAGVAAQGFLSTLLGG